MHWNKIIGTILHFLPGLRAQTFIKFLPGLPAQTFIKFLPGLRAQTFIKVLATPSEETKEIFNEEKNCLAFCAIKPPFPSMQLK